MSVMTESPPQTGFNLPWSVALLLTAVGAVVLVAAIATTGKHSDPDANRYEKEATKLQNQMAEAEKALATEREKGKAPAAELIVLEERNKTDAGRLAMREVTLKELEEKNRQKIAQVQQQIEETKRQLESEKKQVSAQASPEDQERAKFTAAMGETQNAIVTIVSQGVVGTGFFISGFKQPTIITTAEVGTADQDLNIKLRNAENAGDNEPFDGTARRIYADKETGLVFLSYTPKEQGKVATLSRKTIREAQRGEKVVVIATLVHGGEHFGEFSASSGTVSNADVAKGDKKFLQLAVPTNTGSFGSPVLGLDAKLLGVVVGRVEGMEKSVFAIPATEIPKAITRLIEALSKQ